MLDLYNCALWKAQEHGIPAPETHYACNRGSIAHFFEIAQTDDVTLMFEVWRADQGYNPDKNWVWEPENPHWQPHFDCDGN